MKLNFITFGTTDKYSQSLERIKMEALNMKFFDMMYIYNETNFDKEYLDKYGEFYKNNNRGYGFWLWKSYFIKKTFSFMKDGDMLIYADAGCTLMNTPEAIDRLKEYIIMCNNDPTGNIGFEMDHLEKKYTKKSVFDKLNAHELEDSKQLMATIVILKKTPFTVDLINKYYDLIHNDTSLIDDTKENEITEFIDHRHDQSVFSILRKQMGCIIVPDETWYASFTSEAAKKTPILATRIRT